MRLAVVTIVHGRHQHLARQRAGLLAGSEQPLVHVVVSMGDDAIAEVISQSPGVPTELVSLDPEAGLPLARARNVGVAHAAGLGAEAVALLDVDCIPERALVRDYRALLRVVPDEDPAVISGRVRYLPEGMGEDDYAPARLEALGEDHAGRVVRRATWKRGK